MGRHIDGFLGSGSVRSRIYKAWRLALEDDGPELLEVEGFAGIMTTGRWIMAFLQVTISVILLFWNPSRPIGAYIAMALLIVYNVVVLGILWRPETRRLPIRWTLMLDIAFLTNVCYWTEGTNSAFLGLFYLVVFVAALFYNFRGGLVVGAVAATVTFSFGLNANETHHWNIVKDTAPYFVIVGCFTGFLVGQTKVWFQAFRLGMERTRQADRQASLVQQESAVRERELTLARDVQRASLPLTTPRIPGLELTVRSEQAAEVGGDFHVFVTDAEAAVTGICIGDVSGKGMAAALIATSVANVFPYLNPLSSPLSALQRLHGDLIQRLADGSFVSLFFTIVDGTDGRVRYWNAGHPPMLHWHAETGECDVLTYGDSAPLGMLTAWTTQMRRVQLQRGDILVVCSDGITESVESLDEAKILPLTVGIVQRVAPDGADAVADALVAASREHVRSSADDLTVIVARYHGS